MIRPLIVTTLLLAGAVAPVQAGRLADISIYDRNSRQTLPVYHHAGGLYVAGEPGHEYQIVLRNRHGGDLLAVMSIDGINVISGETASPDQAGYVLTGGDSVEVKGWRKSLKRVARFYFTSLPNSYAARTGRPDDVGVIGVALFRRKEPPRIELLEDRAAEAESKAGSAARSAPAPGLGTGHGRNERDPARYVEFERAAPLPDEVIAIYYDSRVNLVAAGVIPSSPRHPRPFPARFVPDPPC